MIIIPWSTFSSILSSAPVDFTCIPAPGSYYVWTDSLLKLVCVIPRDGGADQIDFETNYKANGLNFAYETVNKYSYITGNSTTTVKSGPTYLQSILVGNNTTGGTVTIYDNTLGQGTVVLDLHIGSPSGGLLSSSGQPGPVHLTDLDIKLTNGLTVVTTGSTNNSITVCYR